MATMYSILTDVLDFKYIHISSVDSYTEDVTRHDEVFTVKKIIVNARPIKRMQKICPYCNQKCPGYDMGRNTETLWRAPNLNGVPVFIKYNAARIKCSDHGIVEEWLPWEDPGSRFTQPFNDEVAWMSTQMNKTAISTYLGINWRTVGNCVKAAHDRLEPDIRVRLRNLRHICVDEVAYKKGYAYITVVYDMDRNRVVWIHVNHGLSVFEEFCKELTKEERANIELVAGDGAKWIDTCVEKYFPNARRCVDFFHVVEWVNEALDDVRTSTASKARREYNNRKAAYEAAAKEASAAAEEAARKLQEARAELEAMPRKGRPGRRKKELLEFISRLEAAMELLGENISGKEGRKRAGMASLTPEQQEELDELERKAKEIKGARHALGHAPEKCTENQTEKIKLIEMEYPDLFQAYQMKETLRLILHMRDPKQASQELDDWIVKAGCCGLRPMEKLSEKIQRHRENILNAITYQANSSRSEATNTTIKYLIRRARGFHNVDNLIALVYLKCSDLEIPLHNRIQPSAQKAAELRDRANEMRRARQEASKTK